MVRATRASGEKPLFWVGSSKRDLLTFPEEVKDDLGVALSVAQFGGKHPSAKPWKGEGPGVLEIVEDHRGDTYRAVYTVRFEGIFIDTKKPNSCPYNPSFGNGTICNCLVRYEIFKCYNR